MSEENQVTDEQIFSYLEDLRESGVCNMFNGATYLERQFGLSRREAQEKLLKWMNSYG